MPRLGIKKYTIKEYDTVQNIAKNQLGDSSLWYELAVFNKLDYPYIVDIDNTAYATGYVTFYRDEEESDTDVIIHGGTILSTDIESETIRYYNVVSTTVMSEGQNFIEVLVQSQLKGINGETKVGLVNTLTSSITGVSSVINKEEISIFALKVNAYGTVTYEREEGVAGIIVIPAGRTLSTEYSIDTKTQVRYYRTTEAITMQESENSVNVPIRCTQYGEIGNVSSKKIIVQQEPIVDINGNSLIARVYNNEQLSNGAVLKVLKPGDTLLVPENLDRETTTDPNILDLDTDKLLYGEDLFLNTEGDLELDNKGDLKSISGLDNLQQAIETRLSLPQGSLFYHPEYGHRVEDFIGVGATKEQLNSVKSEVKRVLLEDPRVSNVANVTTGYIDKAVIVDIDVNVIGSGDTETLTFVTNKE